MSNFIHYAARLAKLKGDDQLVPLLEGLNTNRPWLQPLINELDRKPRHVLGLIPQKYHQKDGLFWTMAELEEELKTVVYLKEIMSVEYVMRMFREKGVNLGSIERLLRAAGEHLTRPDGRETLKIALAKWYNLAPETAASLFNVLRVHLDSPSKLQRTLDKVHCRLPFNKTHLLLCLKVYRSCDLSTAVESILRCLLQLEPEDKLLRSEWRSILTDVDLHDDKCLEECAVLLQRKQSIKTSPIQLAQQRRLRFMERLVQESCAIEGNSMSPEEASQTIKKFGAHKDARGANLMSTSSKSRKEHLEIWGLWKATELMENALSTTKFEMETLLHWHSCILTGNSENAGKIRQSNVHLLNSPFTPPHHDHVASELAKVVEFVREGTNIVSSPIEFAAIAHYAFVHVHPFTDGNGRLGRLLMNFCLQSHGYPPLIIANSERLNYMTSIHMACMGDMRTFIRFIIEQMRRTLTAFIEECEFTCAHVDQPSRFAKSSEAALSANYPSSSKANEKNGTG